MANPIRMDPIRMDPIEVHYDRLMISKDQISLLDCKGKSESARLSCLLCSEKHAHLSHWYSKPVAKQSSCCHGKIVICVFSPAALVLVLQEELRAANERISILQQRMLGCPADDTARWSDDVVTSGRSRALTPQLLWAVRRLHRL